MLISLSFYIFYINVQTFILRLSLCSVVQLLNIIIHWALSLIKLITLVVDLQQCNYILINTYEHLYLILWLLYYIPTNCCPQQRIRDFNDFTVTSWEIWNIKMTPSDPKTLIFSIFFLNSNCWSYWITCY